MFMQDFQGGTLLTYIQRICLVTVLLNLLLDGNSTDAYVLRWK